jgi:hypothetical protein
MIKYHQRVLKRRLDAVEKFEYAFQILLLGFSVVMFTLFLLYGVISLFNRIFYHPVQKQLPGHAADPLHSLEIDPRSSGLSPRVSAAVTAAVFHYLQLQGTAPSRAAIHVQARKPADRDSWAAAGRKILLERRLEHDRLRRKGLYEKI